MKPQNLIVLFIFGLFLFLLPSFAEADCVVRCLQSGESSCGVIYTLIDFGENRAGTVDPLTYVASTVVNECVNDKGGGCKVGGFPSISNSDGHGCSLWNSHWNWTACDPCFKSGVYDESEVKCVVCDGKKEDGLLGRSSILYGDPCDDSYTPVTGDGQCESACGADSRCDEFSSGQQGNCPSGQECSNSCQCVTVAQPDLIITDIRPDGSIVEYTIKNQGQASTGITSYTKLYIDGSYEEYDSVSSLAAGSSATDTFSYNWIENCTGSTVTIKVCADDYDDVDESNEGNNCLTEVWDCPKPDLYVTDFWDDDGFVRYTIRNKGEVDAGPSYTKLYVDGAFEESESLSSLSAGNSKTRSFDYDWIENCTGDSDTIEVCADKAGPNGAAASGGGDVDESNENNNCSDDVWYCLKPDLRIIDVWFSSDRKVNYTIYNQGEAEADSSQSALSVDGSYKTYDSVSSILAGSYSYEYFSGWTCTTGQTYSIEVCADRNDNVDEEDEYNNCLTEPLDCPGECTGTLSVSISGAGTCTVTASLTATLCDGKFWQVKDDGTTKCSGTVSGSPYYYTCSSWTVEVGFYLYRLYVDGAIKDGKSVNCSETPNEPPICDALFGSPSSGGAPLDVIFTGSGHDTDGSIVSYQWDFDGDGTWDQTTSINTTGYTYDTPDNYTARLRVQDDDGAWSDVPSACTQAISVTEPGVALNPPVVITIANPTISEDPSHSGKYRAILTGFLDSLGYDPGTCPNCQCIVWFKWGNSGSYGNSNTPVEMTTEDDYFYYTADNLDPGTTYYFEAFAKNGGSW